WKGLCADSGEKHEPASDIDAAAVESLKALDPSWPIREADSCGAAISYRVVVDRSGIRNVKLTPIGVGGRVTLPPNCFKSPLTKRAPSRSGVRGTLPRA